MKTSSLVKLVAIIVGLIIISQFKPFTLAVIGLLLAIRFGLIKFNY